MSKCAYCQHVGMCRWLKDVEGQGCEFFDDGNKWIPVSERLPEKNGSYLVQVASSDGTATITIMMVEHYNEDGTWLHCDNKRRKVVAWMPLPKPYEGGD